MMASLYRLNVVLLLALISLFLVQCTQSLKLPTKKAADLPAETDAEKQLIDRAKLYFNDKSIDSAITTFKKVLDINPACIRANYYLAKSSLAAGKYNECYNYCQTGLDYDGEYYQHFAACLGECYIGMGRARSAISILTQADKMYPNNDRINYILGKAYNTNLDYTSAPEPLLRYIAINPYFSEAHFELAKAYLGSREYLYLHFPLMVYLTMEANEDMVKEAYRIYNFASKFFTARNNTIYINADNLLKDSPFSGIELTMKLSSFSSEVDTTKLTQGEKLVKKMKVLLNIIDKTYNSGIHKYRDNLLFRIYFKYLGDIYKAGLSEVFTYYIHSQSGIEEVDTWLKNNKDKVDAFRKWVQEYNWDI